MTGTPWTDPEQTEFLLAKLAAFREAREAATLPAFHEKLFDEWFKKWPALVCPTTGKKMKVRLKNWFPNHTKGDAQGVAPGLGRRSCKPLPPLPGVTHMRNLSKVQFYWDQYCKPHEGVRNAMKDAHEEYLRTTSDVKKKNHLTYQQEWSSSRLDNEPEDVQEEVERLWKETMKPTKAKKEGGEVAPEPVPDCKKLQEFDKNIAAVPATIILWMRQLYQQTGMVGTFLVGGPCPGQQGRIGSFAYDWEFGPEKKTFRGQYPEYDTAVKGAWEAYLHTLWTPKERLLRSLDPTAAEETTDAGPSGSAIPTTTRPASATSTPTSLVNATSIPTSVSITPAAATSAGPSPSAAVLPASALNKAAPTTSNATTAITDTISTTTSATTDTPSTSAGKKGGRRRRHKGSATDSGEESDAPDGIDDDVQIGGDSDSWSGVDAEEEVHGDAAEVVQPVRKLKPWEDIRGMMTEYERQRLKTLERNHNLQVSLGLIEKLEETMPATKPKPTPVMRRVDRAISQSAEDGERRHSTCLANKAADAPATAAQTVAITNHTPASTMTSTAAASEPTLPDHPAAHSSIPAAIGVTAGAIPADAAIQPETANATPPTIPVTTISTCDTSQDSHQSQDITIRDVTADEEGEKAVSPVVSPLSTEADSAEAAQVQATNPTNSQGVVGGVIGTIEGQSKHTISSSPAHSTASTPYRPVTPRQPQAPLPLVPPTTPERTVPPAPQKPAPLSAVTNRIRSSPPTPESHSVEQSASGIVEPAPNVDRDAEGAASAGIDSQSQTPSTSDESGVTPFVNPFFDAGKAPPSAHTEAEAELLRELQEWCEEEVKEMVSMWMVVEKLMGYPARDAKDHKLNHKNHPGAVDYWLKCGRPKKSPALGELDEYSDDVRLWWRGLQPEWRTSGEDDWPMSRVLVPSESWSETGKGELNGMFVLLMSLLWWCLRAKSDGQKGEFLSMVEDVTWVLKDMRRQLEEGGPMVDGMLEHVKKSSKKRGKENDGNAAAGKKR